jgi:hypothetical protein
MSDEQDEGRDTGGEVLDLADAIGELLATYHLDEILVAAAHWVQEEGAAHGDERGEHMRRDAQVLRRAVGRLSGEV